MAFRASTKSKAVTKTKASKAEEPVEEAVVAPTLSIDELVSAPKEPEKVEPASPAVGEAPERPQYIPQPRQDRPRMGYDRPRGGYQQ